MPTELQNRPDQEQSLQNQEREKTMNHLSSHLMFEAVVPNPPLALDRAYYPTQEELAALPDKTGENLYWERIQTKQLTDRVVHQNQELQKAEYQGKTRTEQQSLHTENWRQSNIRWIQRANQSADAPTRMILMQGLRAVGIDISQPGEINGNLDNFLQTYGNRQDGARKYVEAIAQSCVNPDRGFDYKKFNAIKDSMTDFTTGNFGDTQQVEQLFTGYLDAYVNIEYTIHNNTYQLETTTQLVEKIKAPVQKPLTPEQQRREDEITRQLQDNQVRDKIQNLLLDQTHRQQLLTSEYDIALSNAILRPEINGQAVIPQLHAHFIEYASGSRDQLPQLPIGRGIFPQTTGIVLDGGNFASWNSRWGIRRIVLDDGSVVFDRDRYILEHNLFATELASPTTQEAANRVQQEIFAFAENKDKVKATELLNQSLQILEREKTEGKGKLQANIEQTARSVTEYTRDGEVVFLPETQGKLVVVGDIHGDLATVKQILTKEAFIENMESGDKSAQIVFMGDLVDRGPKSVEVMQLVLELKRRYPKNVTLMKADHEVYAGVSPHDFNNKIKEFYDMKNMDKTGLTASLNTDWDTNMTSLLNGTYSDEDKEKIKQLAISCTTSWVADASWNPVEILRQMRSIPNLTQEDKSIIDQFINTRVGHHELAHPLFGGFFKVFDALPRMTVSANGAVLAHGGPARETRNLAQLANLSADQVRDVFNWEVTWADPIPQSMVAREEQIKQRVLNNLELFLQQNTGVSDDSEVLFNENDLANPATGRRWELKLLRNVLQKMKKSNNIYFNGDRGATSYCDAVSLGMLLYSEQGLKQFLDGIGGKFMIRGHQTSSDVDGGHPNMFNDTLWTIHSTGSGSSESHYKGRELHPKYAVLKLNQPQTQVQPENIKPVW